MSDEAAHDLLPRPLGGKSLRTPGLAAIAFSLAWLAASGCSTSPQLRFTTESGIAHPTDGPAANETAIHPVPEQAPLGVVAVTLAGLEEMELAEDSGNIQMIRVRVLVSNRDSIQPWTLDTREQRLELADGVRITPTLAVPDREIPPALTILPGEETSIDLYYPLGKRDPRDALERVKLHWILDAGGTRVARSSEFRSEPTPGPARVAALENQGPGGMSRAGIWWSEWDRNRRP